jgi:hypothetical protein
VLGIALGTITACPQIHCRLYGLLCKRKSLNQGSCNTAIHAVKQTFTSYWISRLRALQGCPGTRLESTCARVLRDHFAAPLLDCNRDQTFPKARPAHTFPGIREKSRTVNRAAQKPASAFKKAAQTREAGLGLKANEGVKASEGVRTAIDEGMDLSFITHHESRHRFA